MQASLRGTEGQFATQKLNLISVLSFKTTMNEHARIGDLTKKQSLCSNSNHAFTLQIF